MNAQINFRKAEIIFDVFMIALGGLLFYESAITKATVEEPLTASVYGMIISALFLIALLARFFKLAANKEAEDGKKVVIGHPKLILFAGVFTLLYTIGLIKIGYYVSTFFFSSIMIMILKEKQERTVKTGIITIAGCLVFTVALYFIFKTFKVYLPNAWLI